MSMPQRQARPRLCSRGTVLAPVDLSSMLRIQARANRLADHRLLAALAACRDRMRLRGALQCAINTGSVIELSTVREAPPSTSSRARLWP